MVALVAGAIAVLAAEPGPLQAQAPTWWLEASAAHTQPPGGLADVRPATFGILGTRLRAAVSRRAALEAGGQLGSGTARDAGGWYAGSAAGDLAVPLGRAIGRVRAETFGLSYTEPASYTAYGYSIRPRASVPLGRTVVGVRGELTRGRSIVSVPSEAEPGGGGRPGQLPPFLRRPAESDVREVRLALGVSGAALEIARPLGSAWLAVDAEGYRAKGAEPGPDRYQGVGATLGGSLGRVDGAAAVRVWRDPFATEVGYTAAVGWSVTRDLRAQVSAGRTVRDPLYGTPGSFAVSVGVSWRLGGADRSPARVVVVGEPVENGRRVTFRLRAPSAGEAALAGDFNGWEPAPMRRTGSHWTLDVVLEPGLHRFAFLLDGERWMVPDDAPGIGADGWGRRNASIVIEPG